MTFAVLCPPCLPAQLKLPWRFKQLFPSVLAGRLRPFPSCCSKFIFFTIFHRGSSSFCRSSGDTQHETEPAPTYRTGLPSMASPVSLQQIWCFQAYFCVWVFWEGGFASRRFGLEGFWCFLFVNDDFWLKDHLGIRGQRRRRVHCFRSWRRRTSPRSCFSLTDRQSRPERQKRPLWCGSSPKAEQPEAAGPAASCWRSTGDVLKFSGSFFPCQDLIRGKVAILFL